MEVTFERNVVYREEQNQVDISTKLLNTTTVCELLSSVCTSQKIYLTPFNAYAPLNSSNSVKQNKIDTVIFLICYDVDRLVIKKCEDFRSNGSLSKL